jgi:hypothetical protein
VKAAILTRGGLEAYLYETKDSVRNLGGFTEVSRSLIRAANQPEGRKRGRGSRIRGHGGTKIPTEEGRPNRIS